MPKAKGEAPARLTAELGRSGLKTVSGYIQEEYDPDIRGIRAIRVFEEMRKNDATCAVGLRVISWVLGQVNWSVEAAGESAADKEAAEFLDSCRDDMSHTWTKFIRDANTCLPFGFCLPGDAEVMRGDGSLCRIEEVQPGDHVLAGSGKPRLVEARSERYYNGELVVAKTRGQISPIRVTPEHRVWTQNGWKPAGELTVGDRMLQPALSMEHGGDYEEGWLIGLFLAEGHRRKDSKNTVIFTVHQKEAEAVRERLDNWRRANIQDKRDCVLEMAQTATSVNSIVVQARVSAESVRRWTSGAETKRRHPRSNSAPKNTAHVSYTDPQFRALIDKWVNLVPQGKHVGAHYKALKAFPAERDFARGILDGWLWGDGHSGHGTITGTTVSKTLAWQMLMIAGSIDLPANLKRDRNGEVWRVTATPQKRIAYKWTEEAAVEAKRLRCEGVTYRAIAEALRVTSMTIWKWMGKEEPRRQGLQSVSSPEGVWRRVEAITREPYSGMVYDLQVAEDHSFLTAGCMVHNSWLEVVYKQRAGTEGKPASRYDDGRLGWRKIKLIGHDSLYSWDIDPIDSGVRAFIQAGDFVGDTYVPQVRIPIEKSVLFRIDDEKNNPEGVSLLRAAYRPWYIKKNIEEVEAIGIERDLTGVLIIHLPVNATLTDKNKAVDLLEQYKSDEMAGFVAPQFGPGEHERWGFEIISSPGSKTIDTDKTIGRYRGEIATNFLAQFLLLGQGESGSWSLGRDQRDFFEVALGAILNNLEETINRFLVPPLFRFNQFGKLSGLPQLRAGKISKSDMDKFSNAMQRLAQSGFLTPGAKLEQFVRQELDLPELSEEELEEMEKAKEAARELLGKAAQKQPEKPSPTEETGQGEKDFAEDDEDEEIMLPDPEDDDLWEEIERESKKRLTKRRKIASELFQLARPYNYNRKVQELADDLRDEMDRLARELREGRIKQSKWSYESRVALVRYSVDGYLLGTAESTGVAPSKVKLTTEQRRMALEMVEGQHKYFAEFASKVKGQLGEGKELTTAVDARARLYQGAVKSAYEKAKLDGKGEERLQWVRFAGDSCPTCIEHGGKVRTASEWKRLNVWPAFNVACRGNCRCRMNKA